mgnify:CR=1 FL=1
MKNKRIAQIVLPILIIGVVAGIWFLKNSSKSQPKAPLETPLEITKLDMDEMLSHGLPVILDFGADACPPCLEMYSDLVAINAEMQGRAIVHFIDVWKYPDEARDFPVQVIPTQTFFTSDRKPYVPSESLRNTIDFKMYSLKDTGEHIYTMHEGPLTKEQMLSILEDMGVK